MRSMLGLAQRAGKVVSGDLAVQEVCRRGRARMLILAADAGTHTKKTFQRLSVEAGIALVETGTRAELGHALGKSPRAILAVTSDQFVKGIRQILTRVETKDTSE